MFALEGYLAHLICPSRMSCFVTRCRQVRRHWMRVSAHTHSITDSTIVLSCFSNQSSTHLCPALHQRSRCVLLTLHTVVTSTTVLTNTCCQRDQTPLQSNFTQVSSSRSLNQQQLPLPLLLVSYQHNHFLLLLLLLARHIFYSARPGGYKSCCTGEVLKRAQQCTDTGGVGPCITIIKNNTAVTPITPSVCLNGIQNGDVCCSTSCGTCGGGADCR
jgi:hypothetical protein